MPGILGFLLHHSEPGDPVLLQWIQHQIDAITGLGSGAIVVGLGVVVFAIPAVILGAYFFIGPRRGGAEE